MARKSLFAAGAAALTVAACIFCAVPASADIIPRGPALWNTTINACLDDSLAYGLRMFPCNVDSIGHGFQSWSFVAHPYSSTGGFEIQNVNTDRCVDDSGYGVRSFPCNEPSWINGYQDWYVVNNDPANPNYYQLYNVATRECLDVSPQYGLRHFPCSPSSYVNGFQRWIGILY
jgi:hypothetical protein